MSPGTGRGGFGVVLDTVELEESALLGALAADARLGRRRRRVGRRRVAAGQPAVVVNAVCRTDIDR